MLSLVRTGGQTGSQTDGPRQTASLRAMALLEVKPCQKVCSLTLFHVDKELPQPGYSANAPGICSVLPECLPIKAH